MLTDHTAVQEAASVMWPTNEQQFDALAGRHTPTVFRGVAAQWLPHQDDPAATLDWLEALLGERVVVVTVGLPSNAGFVGAARVDGARSIQTTVGGARQFRMVAEDLRAELRQRSGHVVYLQSVDVEKVCPELLPFLKLPLEGCKRASGHWKMWIGSGEHRVSLHYDRDENFFCLLTGRKRFHIAPFDVLRDVYVGPLEGNFGVPNSLVDPRYPDLDAYPRFARARERMLTVELEAGDVLYLPANWWHYVESFGFNVAANYWWSDITAASKATNDLAFLNGLLAFRSLPSHWRTFWRDMYDYFVFRSDGDPYDYLPVEEQGWAGASTAKQIEEIRRIAASLERQLHGMARYTTELPECPFKVAPAMRLRFESADAVVLRDVERGTETTFGLSILAIIAQFAQPRTPQEVMNRLGTAGLKDENAAVWRGIQRLAADGFIVPAQ